MSRTSVNSAHGESIPRLLYDVETVAKILSLTPATVDQLCRLGELRPSVTVGNRRLFSVRDLEQFANAETPREIDLSVATAGVSA
jgi:DNA-binding transcriptional MerR regulator